MKVAIIGSGFGRYAMAPVYEKLGFEVELATPRDAAAVDRMLDGKVDLVSVHSPPFMHHEHVLKALDRGHAVLCDKPFGRNGAEARAMRDAAKKAGALNFLNCEIRQKPARTKLKALLDEGAIGPLQHVSFTFFSNGLRGREHGWLNDKSKSGGWIGAWGSHAIDATRWLFADDVADCGGISRVETKLRPDGKGGQTASTAEDAFTAFFVMRGGGTASIDTAYSAGAPLPSRIVVLGRDGVLELVSDMKLILRKAPTDLDDPSIPRAERVRRSVLAGEGELVFEAPPPPGEAHEPALTPWLGQVQEALRTGRQITPSFDDGVAVAEVIEALKTKMIHVGGPAQAARTPETVA